jgi:hypothetical protein
MVVAVSASKLGHSAGDTTRTFRLLNAHA